MFLLFHKKNSDELSEILKDQNIKKYVIGKQQWHQYLLLTFKEDANWGKTLSYIMLKYGDDIKDFSTIVPDLSPIPNIDYYPKKILVNGKYVNRNQPLDKKT